MAYYPKSQVQTNLYTNGKELAFISTKKEYIGSYWKTSKGTYYSGQNPNSLNSEPLMIMEEVEDNPLLPPTVVDQYDVNQIAPRKPGFWTISDLGYKKSQLPKPGDVPLSFYPVPTEKDYNLGEFERYFLNRIGKGMYIEVNQLTYNQYIAKDSRAQWALFTPFKLTWELTGIRSGEENSAFEINKRTVERVQRKHNLKGFDKYFKNNFIQFFRFSEGENLYTPGGEFMEEIIKEGFPTVRKDYVGFYHIHPDKGPMVGAQHVGYKHNFLIPYDIDDTDDKMKKYEARQEAIRETATVPQQPAPNPTSTRSSGY
tara:strand:- start:711 stop:1652 length:942 start_codon:yes stop_codon:yes gene_type:complete